MNPESALEKTSSHEREAIRSAVLTTSLEQRRRETVQVYRILPLNRLLVVDLEIRTKVTTYEGPLRACSLLDLLRKGRLPFFTPSPTAETGMNRRYADAYD
jgi:hypothetical protein